MTFSVVLTEQNYKLVRSYSTKAGCAFCEMTSTMGGSGGRVSFLCHSFPFSALAYSVCVLNESSIIKSTT